MSYRDILINDGDLDIKDGDFVIGPSEEQEIDFIIRSQKGEWRQWPLIGFGVIKWIRSVFRSSAFKQQLDTELRQDGFSEVDIQFGDQGKFRVAAYRN